MLCAVSVIASPHWKRKSKELTASPTKLANPLPDLKAIAASSALTKIGANS